MSHLRRSLAACLLALSLVSLCGCAQTLRDNLLLEKEEPVSDESEEPQGPQDYLSSYRNLSFTLPEGWSVTQDRVSRVTAAAPGGTSVEITFSEGLGRVSRLLFPASGQDAAHLLEADGYSAGTYTLLEEEYFVFSEGRESESSFYHFLIQGEAGEQRLYAGVRTDTQAYQVLALIPAGAEADLAAVTELIDTITFPDSEPLTTAFASGISSEPPDPELAEPPEEENVITVTCISPVNVRTAPNAHSSQIIGSLRTGDVIKVTGEEGGWYQFEYQGQTAYSYKKYFQ